MNNPTYLMFAYRQVCALNWNDISEVLILNAGCFCEVLAEFGNSADLTFLGGRMDRKVSDRRAIEKLQSAV